LNLDPDCDQIFVNAYRESPNLDFLRSAAVLLVVFSHLLLLFEKRGEPGIAPFKGLLALGEWGVLIFFVHTSLVLMFSLERQHNRFEGKPAHLPFLARRIFRIYPLSVCIVLVVIGFGIPVSHFSGSQLHAAHLSWEGNVANLLLLQNLTHTDSVLVPLWSLPYEMQMYLLLPLLYLVARNTRRMWPMLTGWGVAVILGMHSVRLGTYGVPDFIKYVPYFLAGVIAYQLSKSWSFRLPALLWPAVVALLTAAFVARPLGVNPWLCSMLLGVMIPQFRELTNTVVCRMSHVIARYSYGVYLTHFICIWLAFQAISAPTWVRWVTFLVTATALPVAAYHLVEHPMIRAGERVAGVLRERPRVRVHVPA
jgi:peptidoglycan/LPS O-acetylase OafA/YrhL